MQRIETQSWLNKLRYRLEDFRATAMFSRGLPCSLKIRPQHGLFSRSTAPHSYALIDAATPTLNSGTLWLSDHDTGPELLCILGGPPEARHLQPQVASLLASILQASIAGVAAGDALASPLEILLRGFDEQGQSFESCVLCLDPAHETCNPERINNSFAERGIRFMSSAKALRKQTSQPA